MQDLPLQTDLPATPRLRWWDLVWPPLGGAVLFALVTAGIAMAALVGGGATGIQKLVNDLTSAGQGYVLNMGLMAAIYLPPLLIMFWIGRRKQLAFFRAVPWRTIGWALAGGVLYAAAFQLIQDFLVGESLVTFKPSVSELLLIPHNYVQLALGLAVAAIWGPFVEEFYFRGFLLTWCRGKMALVWATLINAVAFGMVHFYFLMHPGGEGIFVTVVIGLFGALNVWWTVRTRSLWPAFASHLAYNGAGLILMFLFPGSV